MASTPSSLWMNTTTTDASPAVISQSPRTLTGRGFASPTKSALDQSFGLNLDLKKVLGTTVSSVNGFDSLPSRSTFATCAGSTAVLYSLGDDLAFTQRYFRSRPHGPVGSGPVEASTQQGTPDWRGRPNGSIRASNFGTRGPASPAAEFANSPSKGSVRQRTRAATCLSLSPDGKLLAVGETGYIPRILMFSTGPDGSESPYSMLSEHTFGVRCLSFSPDSRWLCSVGDIHDGFIFLWSISPRIATPKLHASNKCTAFVQDMTWMGNSIVTVGVRHVKIWRTDSLGPPSPSKNKFRTDLVDASPSSPSGSKTLPGRNCLLGTSLESTFTCVTAIGDSKAVLCTDKGDVCLLDDSGNSPNFARVRKLGLAIKCVSADWTRQLVWIGGSGGEIWKFPFSTFDASTISQPTEKLSRSSSMVSSGSDYSAEGPSSIALGIVGKRLIMIDADHCINVYDAAGQGDFLSHSSQIRKLQSHSSPVLGLVVFRPELAQHPRMATWDTTGRITFWTLEGEHLQTSSVELDKHSLGEDYEPNELKILRSSASGHFCVSGDKYGVMRLLTGEFWRTEEFALKAHTSEINDMAITRMDDKTELIGTCGRDRTIQIYEKTAPGTSLIQTIEQHASSVNSILFVENGHTLCSASSDRTVVVHTLAVNDDLKAYLPTRILTTKQSPVSIVLWPYEEAILAVTTMDKQLHKFDVTSGQCLSSVRLSDEASNSTVMLSSLLARTISAALGPLRVVFGVSSTDKSIRIHDLESGSAILRDYGHSEGLTNVSILSESKQDEELKITIASTGLDGTVMLWEFTNQVERNTETAPSPVIETPSSQQPLRRVLSKSAIMEFSKTLEASGMSPVPPTPSRNPSPNRGLRKKVSKYSMTGTPSAKMSTPPPLRRPNRSPSPPSPATPATSNGAIISQSQRKPILRVKSVGNFNELAYSADQLAKSMRTFRKRIVASSEALKLENIKELERELSLTAKAIGQNARRRQSVSELNVGDLLDEYSDKLAQMVQEKVNLGSLKDRRKNSAASGENTKP